MKHTNHYIGLTPQQVEESRLKHGSNIITPVEKVPLWKQYLEKFEDPLIVILLIAGVLSVGISCYEYFGLHEAWTVFFEPIGIFVAILLATGLGFYFELSANKEFSVLNQISDDETVKAFRNGNVIEIARKEVVVGDIIIINTGDEIPADGTLLESVTMHVDESSLTGEPICKKTHKEELLDPEATYASNIVLRGTKVMEGHGVYEVTAVGDETENGKVFKEAQIDNSTKTPLSEQLDRLGSLVSNISYSIAGLVIVGRLLHHFDWHPIAWSLSIPVIVFFWLVIRKFNEWSRKACITTIISFVLLFVGMVLGIHEILLPSQDLTSLLAHTLNTLMIAVTLIVVAVPEGLPMAITLSLAYSMRSMLKTNNLVRKMHACETMGAATIICTDKTGTLTQNKMQVHETRFYNLKEQIIDINDNECQLIAEGIAVNSTASLDFSKSSPSTIGNPTEGALLLWLHNQGIDYRNIKENAERIYEVPFSTERKYMATIVNSAFSGKRILFVKGAPEIVFAMCKNSPIAKEAIQSQLLNYQNKAMRTLGFAYKELSDDYSITKDSDISSQDLSFLGIVAISDPVRDDVSSAVEECMKAGIAVKIVTGDTVGTAKEIARQINLWKDTDTDLNIITGSEFAELSDEELLDRVMELKIIARARPMDKKRLVEALQKKNQVVAVTGDGTNDAPALSAAHVGLSMGDGTSVAKEASDITIIDNSFSSICHAVMWGRSLYKNIKRFLLFQLTVNVSACLIVLIGAFIGTESPLTVTQMLWVNLIMDTFGAMALASLPPTAEVMKDKPRDRNDFILNKQMYANILGVGISFFVMLFGLLFIFQHADITSMQDFVHLKIGHANAITPYEQTLLFSLFVWTHFWYMFNARTYETGKSFFSVKKSTGFWTIVIVIFFGQFIITELLPDFFNVDSFHSHGSSGWIDSFIIIVLSSLVLWIREIKCALFHTK